MENIDRYYKVLGLEPGVSQEDVKQAYRDMAKVWHPDRFPNDPKLQQKAQEKLKEINGAYQKLLSAKPSPRETATQAPPVYQEPKGKGGRSAAQNTPATTNNLRSTPLRIANSKGGKRTPMIVGAVLVIAVVVVGGAMLSGGRGGNKPIAISPIPAVTEDVQQSLEAFRGKVVIVDFWATWCGPCRMEIPSFIQLQEKYRDQGLEIVGVSIDPIAPRGNPGGAPAVAPFMKSNGINYTILMVNSATALRGYDVSQGIPTTYVLDRSGRVVRTYIGVKPISVFESDINSLL